MVVPLALSAALGDLKRKAAATFRVSAARTQLSDFPFGPLADGTRDDTPLEHLGFTLLAPASLTMTQLPSHAPVSRVGAGKGAARPGGKAQRKKPCKFYKEGHCSLGDGCAFQHVKPGSQQQQQQQLECDFLSLESDCRGAHCRRTHVLPAIDDAVRARQRDLKACDTVVLPDAIAARLVHLVADLGLNDSCVVLLQRLEPTPLWQQIKLCRCDIACATLEALNLLRQQLAVTLPTLAQAQLDIAECKFLPGLSLLNRVSGAVGKFASAALVKVETAADMDAGEAMEGDDQGSEDGASDAGADVDNSILRVTLDNATGRETMDAGHLVVWPEPGLSTWAVNLFAAMSTDMLVDPARALLTEDCGPILQTLPDPSNPQRLVVLFDILAAPLAAIKAQLLSLSGETKLQLESAVRIAGAHRHQLRQLRMALRPFGAVRDLRIVGGGRGPRKVPSAAIVIFDAPESAVRLASVKTLTLAEAQTPRGRNAAVTNDDDDDDNDIDGNSSDDNDLFSHGSDEDDDDGSVSDASSVASAVAAHARAPRTVAEPHAQKAPRTLSWNVEQCRPADMNVTALPESRIISDTALIVEAVLGSKTREQLQAVNMPDVAKLGRQLFAQAGQARGFCRQYKRQQLFDAPPCNLGLQCKFKHCLEMCHLTPCNGTCSKLHPSEFITFRGFNTWCEASSLRDTLAGRAAAATTLGARMDKVQIGLRQRHKDIDARLQANAATVGGNVEDSRASHLALQDERERLDTYLKQLQHLRHRLAIDRMWSRVTFARLRTLHRECTRLELFMPILKQRQVLERFVTSTPKGVMVLEAETGAGKSTQIVQYLLDALQTSMGRLVCTQPRALSCDALAERVSEELGVKPNTLVVSRTQPQQRPNRNARIEFVTAEVLLEELKRDPLLLKYRVVVVDEVHERSLFTDLNLPFLRHTMAQRTTPFHVLLTSATMDTTRFVDYFQKPDPTLTVEREEVKGRCYPIRDFYFERSNSLVDSVLGAIERAQRSYHHTPRSPAHVLVFLARVQEIEQVKQRLDQVAATSAERIKVMVLHEQLSWREQSEVFKESPLRKVVLATSVAETAITIKGVSVVIDTGEAEQQLYDRTRGMSVLRVSNITQASAEQRRGRAGRTQPGACLHLYSQETLQSWTRDTIPELMRCDPTEAIVYLTDLVGDRDLSTVEFLDAPASSVMQAANFTLRALGMLDEKNKLTWCGRIAARLRRGPRMVAFLLECIQREVLQAGVFVLSVLEVGTKMLVTDHAGPRPLAILGCPALGELGVLAMAVSDLYNRTVRLKGAAYFAQLETFCKETGIKKPLASQTLKAHTSWIALLKRNRDWILKAMVVASPPSFNVDSWVMAPGCEPNLKCAIVRAYFDNIVWLREQGVRAAGGHSAGATASTQRMAFSPSLDREVAVRFQRNVGEPVDTVAVVFFELAEPPHGSLTASLLVPVPPEFLADPYLPKAYLETIMPRAHVVLEDQAVTRAMAGLSIDAVRALKRYEFAWMSEVRRWGEVQFANGDQQLRVTATRADHETIATILTKKFGFLDAMLQQRTAECKLAGTDQCYVLVGPGFQLLSVLGNSSPPALGAPYASVTVRWPGLPAQHSMSGRWLEPHAGAQVERRSASYSCAPNHDEAVDLARRLVGTVNAKRCQQASDRLCSAPGGPGVVAADCFLAAAVYSLEGDERAYSRINAALRTGQQEDIASVVALIAPLRGACLHPNASGYACDAAMPLHRGLALTTAELSLYQESKIVYWFDFVSTTESYAFATEVAQMQGHADEHKHAVVMVLNRAVAGTVGLRLATFSDFAREQEVLLPPGTMIEVDSVTTRGDVTIIACTVLKPTEPISITPAKMLTSTTDFCNVTGDVVQWLSKNGATDVSLRRMRYKSDTDSTQAARAGRQARDDTRDMLEGWACFSSQARAAEAVASAARGHRAVFQTIPLALAPRPRDAVPSVHCKVTLTFTQGEFAGSGRCTLADSADHAKAVARGKFVFELNGSQHEITVTSAAGGGGAAAAAAPVGPAGSSRAAAAKEAQRAQRRLELNGFPVQASMYEIGTWIEQTLGSLEARFTPCMNWPDKVPNTANMQLGELAAYVWAIGSSLLPSLFADDDKRFPIDVLPPGRHGGPDDDDDDDGKAAAGPGPARAAAAGGGGGGGAAAASGEMGRGRGGRGGKRPKQRKEDKYAVTAVLHLKSAEHVDEVMKMVASVRGNQSDLGYLTAEPEAGCIVPVPAVHTDDQRRRLELAVRDFCATLVPAAPGARVTFDKVDRQYRVQGTHTASIEFATRALYEFFNGQTVVVDQRASEAQYLRADSAAFKTRVAELEDRFKTIVTIPRRGGIKLMGPREQVHAAVDALRLFLDDDSVQTRVCVYVPRRHIKALEAYFISLRARGLVAADKGADRGSSVVVTLVGPASVLADEKIKLHERIVGMDKARKGTSEEAEEACCICMADLAPAEVMRLHCMHAICTANCVPMFVANALGNNEVPMRCGTCQAPLTLAEAEELLTISSTDRGLAALAALRVYKTKRSAEIYPCPSLNCSGFHERTNFDSKCAVCDKKFCGACTRVPHPGKTCAAVREEEERAAKNIENERLTLELLSKIGKRCTCCGNHVEKSEGCNAMKCRCGGAFCYLCGKDCGTDAHPHFGIKGTPCFEKLFDGVYN